MIGCGTQCLVCDYPIHMDSYRGCEHGCLYCFANEKGDKRIERLHQKKDLIAFIQGRRNSETRFIDWNIPIHFGANSDPFQPCERQYQKTIELLEVFEQYQYPFIISTKSTMIAEMPYIDVLERCRCVVQMSVGCSKYDKYEPYAPTYEEKMECAKEVSSHVTRLILRIQPFFAELFDDIMQEIPRYAKSGAYGIIVEGYSTRMKRKSTSMMQWNGRRFDYHESILAPMYKQIRDKCHEYGLRFFSGEDRLRFLGDSLTCCGTEGLPDFVPNKYNIEHLAHDSGIEPTDTMKRNDTFRPFRSIRQSSEWEKIIHDKSFEYLMHYVGDDYIEWYQELRERYGD